MPEFVSSEDIKRLREIKKLYMDLAKSFKKGSLIRKGYEQEASNTEKKIQKLKNAK